MLQYNSIDRSMSQREKHNEQTHSRYKFHEKQWNCLELNPHMWTLTHIVWSRLFTRWDKSCHIETKQRAHVCLRDTKSTISVALDGHWPHTECSRAADHGFGVSHQQNMTNLLNKYAFVISTHETLGLFTSPVSCRGRPIIGADIKHFTDYRYRPF